MNAPCTGYYSLLQYCPDRSRMEAANVGVLLFCPEVNYLRVRMATDNDRVRRFFRDEAGDLEQINVVKRMFEHRLEIEAPEIRSLESLGRFGRLLANELVMTDPRSVRVENPDAELALLFEELVGGRVRRDPEPEPRVLDALRLRLESPLLSGKVKRDVRVKVPTLGEELAVPYAYQNGRLNLVEPKEFGQQREADILRDAFKTAVEGHLLFKHPDAELGEMRLVVVASFRFAAADHRRKVEGVLREHDVAFYDESALDRLASEIAATAH